MCDLPHTLFLFDLLIFSAPCRAQPDHLRRFCVCTFSAIGQRYPIPNKNTANQLNCVLSIIRENIEYNQYKLHTHTHTHSIQQQQTHTQNKYECKMNERLQSAIRHSSMQSIILLFIEFQLILPELVPVRQPARDLLHVRCVRLSHCCTSRPIASPFAL